MHEGGTGMTMHRQTWIQEFAYNAKTTDQIAGLGNEHVPLLALGLLGEAGSVLAELKKSRREGAAYPSLRERLREELGDFLWYFVRLVCVLDESLLSRLTTYVVPGSNRGPEQDLAVALQFGAAVGELVNAIRPDGPEDLANSVRDLFVKVWVELRRVSAVVKISLRDAARSNSRKRADRWPTNRNSLPRFDQGYPEEEQLPRRLEIEFLERRQGGRPVVILRSMGLNIGDRLTDNIGAPDGYRYHDVFHLGYVAFLGWSPVIRSLLRCKRKSRPSVDENQDGGRAQVIEEAVSATVFGRAKQLRFFEDINHLDYDLLKVIQMLVQGYEVDAVPLWQWEKAILTSYRSFRALKAFGGGRVIVDLRRRRLDYLPPRS
jgi:hypothetical protein